MCDVEYMLSFVMCSGAMCSLVRVWFGNVWCCMVLQWYSKVKQRSVDYGLCLVEPGTVMVGLCDVL